MNLLIETKCSDCEEPIMVPDDVKMGEIFSCKSCGCDLEVIEFSYFDKYVRLAELNMTSEDWGE